MKIRKFWIIIPCSMTGLIFLSGCQPSKQAEMQTLETQTIEKHLADFKNDPDEAHKRQVEIDFERMESEIHELEERIHRINKSEKSETQQKLNSLRSKYASYKAEFSTAKVSATVEKAGSALQEATRSLGDSFQNDKTNK